MPDASVSTRVASELLSVHESSIKRWCNAGDLPYWSTPGGHRRIQIADLVAFATEHNLSGDILNFGSSAEAVWLGFDAASKQDDLSQLSRLAFAWIDSGKTYLLESLIPFLVDRGIAIGRVFDDVVGAAMVHIGSEYESTALTIGDEHRMTNQVRDALISIRQKGILGSTAQNSECTAISGCIRGGMHEIGALMIRSILEINGWKVVYLGQNVPTEDYHEQRKKHNADLICVSIAPPMGNAEAGEVVRLLDELSDGKPGTRLALGGTMLNEASIPTHRSALTDVRYFTQSMPFETWIKSL